MTMVIGTLKVMAVKSLIIAKAALIISIVVILAKFLKNREGSPGYVEVEPEGAYEFHPPYGYEDFGGIGSYSNNLNAYSPYNEYTPTAAGSGLNYATLAVPIGNNTVPVQVLPAGKRRDHSKKKVAPTILTIRRYSELDSGLI
ncbi:hypothetical protein JTB14_009435 [Gonioctena quinquepunctata]|nr:hypothetical protein JTB14_009435 [Gonioctena quinquepunctata]